MNEVECGSNEAEAKGIPMIPENARQNDASTGHTRSYRMLIDDSTFETLSAQINEYDIPRTTSMTWQRDGRSLSLSEYLTGQ